MSVEVRSFSVSVPAGTLSSAPLVTPMQMPARLVDRIEVEVPPGPRGEVGFRIGSSGVQLIPLQLGQWVITDGRTVDWDLSHQHESGSWELTAYNTGLFAHTLVVRFEVTPPQLVSANPVLVPLSGVSLDSGLAPAAGVAPLALPPPPDLAPPPELPPPPALPALPLPPTPPNFGPGTPGLGIVEDDEMRFIKFQRPDGTIDNFILNSDGAVRHYWTYSDGRPLGVSDPPGRYLALTDAFLYQGQLVLRGEGGDRAIWQTLATLTGQLGWGDPQKVAG